MGSVFSVDTLNKGMIHVPGGLGPQMVLRPPTGFLMPTIRLIEPASGIVLSQVYMDFYAKIIRTLKRTKGWVLFCYFYLVVCIVLYLLANIHI